MTEKRVFRVTRGAADRDPMFAPVWYDGSELLVTRSEPVPEPTPIELPPLQPPDPRDLQWKKIVECANEVFDMLRSDPAIDGEVLIEAVRSLIDSDPTVEDIVAAYRRRMEAKNG